MKHLTATQAAEILELSQKYVAVLMRTKKIPAFKATVDGREQWCARADIVERFKKQREAAAEPVEPQAIDGFGEVRNPLRGEADSVLPGSLWWLT